MPEVLFDSPCWSYVFCAVGGGCGDVRGISVLGRLSKHPMYYRMCFIISLVTRLWACCKWVVRTMSAKVGALGKGKGALDAGCVFL